MKRQIPNELKNFYKLFDRLKTLPDAPIPIRIATPKDGQIYKFFQLYSMDTEPNIRLLVKEEGIDLKENLKVNNEQLKYAKDFADGFVLDEAGAEIIRILRRYYIHSKYNIYSSTAITLRSNIEKLIRASKKARPLDLIKYNKGIAEATKALDDVEDKAHGYNAKEPAAHEMNQFELAQYRKKGI